MSRAIYKIDGQELETLPVEWEDLQVSIDWTGDQQVQIEFDKLTFRNSPTDDVASRIISMRSDNLGVFNGRPFEMNVGGYDLPAMLLNLRRGFKNVGGAECEVAIDMLNQKDKLTTDLAVLQFKRLEDEGKFLPSDYVQIPYNINYIPDSMQLIVLSITTFNLAKSIAELIKETANNISELTTASIPTVPLQNVTVGQILLAILKAAIRIAYFIALAIAIKNLVKQIGEQIYSPTRYHTALKIKSMFRVLCEHVNLEFKSDLLDGAFESQLVLMPSKTEKGNKNINTLNGGAPNRSDNGLYFGTAFIESMMRTFNADYRIYNGVLRFERWDWWKNNSTLTLDSNWTNQKRRLNELTDNADDFKGGYFISMEFDQQDRNTVDKIYGSAYDVITNVNASNAVEYNLAHGGEEINLPFSYGIRKDGLTPFEETLKALFKLVDNVTNLFGNGTNFAGQIESRKGNLQLSDHFTSKPKMLLLEGAKGLAINQQQVFNCKQLWDRYHYINSFYPISGIHNQWERGNMQQKMDVNFFNSILINNFVKDAAGNDVEIEKLVWTFEKDVADIQFRVNKQYEFNLRQTYIIAQNSDD